MRSAAMELIDIILKNEKAISPTTTALMAIATAIIYVGDQMGEAPNVLALLKQTPK